MIATDKTRINQLDFLEALRGLAALYVVIHHARWFLWEGYSNGYLKNPEAFNYFNKALVYFFSLFVYGHEMVIFFFVLSGFVIHLKYSKNLLKGNNKFNYVDYLKRRFKRIYPPLIFAIFLTFILDSIGKFYSFPIYGPDSPFKIVKDNFSTATLIGNCLFVMNTYVDTWGSNFALWSLKFEWWFYMLFPLFFFVLRKSSILAFFSIITLYVLSFYPEYWPNRLLAEVFSSMIVWCLGVFLADVYTERISIQVRFLMPLLLIIPIIIVFKITFIRQIQDLLWGLGFTGILSVFFYFLERGRSLKYLEKWNWLGRFSYSLYITHMPILVFISGNLLKQNRKLPLTFDYVILGIFICIVFAWAIHFLIERPFLSRKDSPPKVNPPTYNAALQH